VSSIKVNRKAFSLRDAYVCACILYIKCRRRGEKLISQRLSANTFCDCFRLNSNDLLFLDDSFLFTVYVESDPSIFRITLSVTGLA